MKTILFDCDGVLADFIKGFTLIANRKYGTPIITTIQQPHWDFNWLLTNKQQEEVWSEIKQSSTWWTSLEPLVSYEVFNLISKLNACANLIFGTNRISNLTSASSQTSRWLEDMGVVPSSVVVTKKKGDLARVIGADFALDDNAENASCIHWISDSPQTKVFLLNRPYNQQPVPKRIIRINSVQEFLFEVGV